MAHLPRLYISAAHKSSGKTTVSLGLCRALRNRGLAVQAFKKGPDYIDPIWHGLASGRPSYNLDFHMMSREEIGDLFSRQAGSADISLIEGNKGLYDGMDPEGTDSNGAMAKLLGAPVVLVLDCQGMTRGVAPLVLGYQAFDRDVNIAGVILNKVGGPRHESKLRAALERYTEVRVLGAVRMDEDMAIVERHLGLMPGNESAEAEQRIEAIARKVGAQVDLDGLLALAENAKAGVPASTASRLTAVEGTAPAQGLRLAYAQDRAFGFYYQEDLDALRDAGATLVPLDTLRDSSLPDCDGLVIGGGFPEMFMEALAANQSLRTHIRQRVEQGLPVYAECGGLMYLSRSLNWDERRQDMVGVVPGDVVMGKRPVGRGYALLEETESSPWSPQAAPVPAHEFHYSHLENLPAGLTYAYRVLRGAGIEPGQDGFVYKNLLASYCHRRGSGPQGWIGPFLDKVRGHRLQQEAARKVA
ncbi:MAG: cobyrinate a,c-diamide synthase [Pseudomonadota bacterium]